MARLGPAGHELRERALVLAREHGIDQGEWYVRVLEVGREFDDEADLGALVRIYWELQRITGRSDLHDVWRRLADAFWAEDAA